MDESTPPPLALKPAAPTPMLPPALLGPGALLWLWVLPIAVLLALNVQGYALIEGNMDDAQRSRALLLGLAGLLNLGGGLGFFFVGRRHLRVNGPSDGGLPLWWALPPIGMQVAYLWLALNWGDQGLLPDTVTEWIYPPQRFFYNQFAFAMPPLFLGLIRVACARGVRHRGRALALNLGLAVGAPLALFAFFQLLMAVRSEWFGGVGPTLVVMLVIVTGVLMFVGLIRGLALLLGGVERWNAAGERVAIGLFALVLPLGGLLLNRQIAFPNNFQAWEVYALTVLNAAVLLLAAQWRAGRPLLALGLLCATLPFTLYFFVVFLPFLPLSVLAVIAMGTGFLVLTPTVLLILHLSLLNRLRHAGSLRARLLIGTLSVLLLPGFFTVRGLADKAALNAALDHVYAPAITDQPISYDSSRANLRRALASHRSYKDGIYYPLLSDFYAWLVFDNLVLPDEKLARLETAFFGEVREPAKDRDAFMNDMFGGGRRSRDVRDRHRMPRAAPPPRTVQATRLDVTTRPAGDAESVVTLKLELTNTGDFDAEFIKTLPLPAGVFVNGFRLHINGEPVPGRITEKKTALWVYTMIRDSERRDPGLLFYNAPDELELRVFPVFAKTPSVVEIDFLVPASVAETAELGAGTTDAALVLAELGRRLSPRSAHVAQGSVVAGGLETLELPAVTRETDLHVIVDRSGDHGFDGDLAAVLPQLAERFPGARTRFVMLANYETREVDAAQRDLEALPLRGGFVAELALAQAMRQHRDEVLDAGRADRPLPRAVFVIVRQSLGDEPPELGLAAEWADLLPAVEIHELDAAGHWRDNRGDTGAEDAPLLRLGESVRPWLAGRPLRFKPARPGDVLEYWDPVDAIWQPVPGVTPAAADGEWARAVTLYSQQQDYARAPGASWTDLKTLVAASRESGVMLASTSYIVVENAAQWRMLDVSERKKLDQNAALDFKEAPAPSWVWLAAGFGLWCAGRRWFKARRGCVC